MANSGDGISWHQVTASGFLVPDNREKPWDWDFWRILTCFTSVVNFTCLFKTIFFLFENPACYWSSCLCSCARAPLPCSFSVWKKGTDFVYWWWHFSVSWDLARDGAVQVGQRLGGRDSDLQFAQLNAGMVGQVIAASLKREISQFIQSL